MHEYIVGWRGEGGSTEFWLTRLLRPEQTMAGAVPLKRLEPRRFGTRAGRGRGVDDRGRLGGGLQRCEQNAGSWEQMGRRVVDGMALQDGMYECKEVNEMHVYLYE